MKRHNMAQPLTIINVPDPLLKTISQEVLRVDDALKKLMDQMAETMYRAPGIGLAAIQVSVPKRLLVIDTSDKEGEQTPQFFINPKVVWSSEETNIYNEGCLSVPEHYAEVERPAEIRLEYLDYNGVPHVSLFDGLDATCLQHEIDHLDGIVFIDYLSKLKRNMIVKKVAKATKDAVVL